MQEMKIEILKLVKEYLKSSKPIDEDYIVRLIGIIVKYRHLSKYLKVDETDFTYDSLTLASYKFRDKKIIFDLAGLTEEAEQYFESFKFDYASYEYAPHIIACETVSHEIEHANQQRFILRPTANVKSRILAASYSSSDFKLLNEQEVNALSPQARITYELELHENIERARIYSCFHDLAPEERLADIWAYKLTIDLLDMIDQESSGLIRPLSDYYKYDSLHFMLNPYRTVLSVSNGNFNISPTMMYLTLMDYDDILSLLEIDKGLSLKSRFEMGLRLSKKEFDSFRQKEEELERRITF